MNVFEGFQNACTDTRIVGGFYIKGALQIQESLKQGSTLTLVAEPENKYDCWAVAVYTEKGEKVGYLPSYLSKKIDNIDDISCVVLREGLEKTEAKGSGIAIRLIQGKNQTFEKIVEAQVPVKQDSIFPDATNPIKERIDEELADIFKSLEVVKPKEIKNLDNLQNFDRLLVDVTDIHY